MPIFMSNLDKAKALFEKGEYVTALSLFKKESSQNEALLYLGIMAENGLGCSLNLKEAAKYYNKAYNNGKILRAGIALARLVQKEGKSPLEIYVKIANIDKKTDPVSKADAKYNLALIQSGQYNDAKKLYDESISIYREHAPYSTKLIQALYNKGQLELRRAETLEAKSTASDSKLANAFTQKAMDLFQEASDLGHRSSAASVLNIEANILFKNDKEAEALKKCNQALSLDPSNNESKFTKASIIYKTAQKTPSDVADAQDKYDQALALLREIPCHDQKDKAYLLRKSLQDKLNDEVSLSICQNAKEALNEVSGKMSLSIDELEPHISLLLNKDSSFTNQILFSDAKRIGQHISQEILVENLTYLEEISANKTKEPKQNSDLKNTLHNNVKNIIKNVNNQSYFASKEDQQLIDRRRNFRNAVQSRLQEFYTICQAVQNEEENIATILQDDSSYKTWSLYTKDQIESTAPYIENIAQSTLIAVHPTAGGIVTAAKPIIKPMINRTFLDRVFRNFGAEDEFDRNNLLKKSARVFCKKINTNQNRDEYSFAIADQLAKKYGDQIDNLSEDCLEKFAYVAVKKMFNQIHNQTKREQIYPKVINNYLRDDNKDTVSFFVDAVANKKNRDKFTSSMEASSKSGLRYKIDKTFDRSPDLTPHKNERITSLMERQNSDQINHDIYQSQKNTYLKEQQHSKKMVKIYSIVSAVTMAGLIVGSVFLGPLGVPIAAACIAGLLALKKNLEKNINANANLAALETSPSSIELETTKEIPLSKQKKIEGKFVERFAKKSRPSITSLKEKKPLENIERTRI